MFGSKFVLTLRRIQVFQSSTTIPVQGTKINTSQCQIKKIIRRRFSLFFLKEKKNHVFPRFPMFNKNFESFTIKLSRINP